MEAPISLDEVQRLARLARLRLNDAEARSMVVELSAIVAHMSRVEELDLEGVEPLSHPLPIINRLDPDEPSSSLPVEEALRNAPAVEGPFITVPKVIAEGES